VQAQLAIARRPPAGRKRPFPALLYVERKKKGEKCMLQATFQVFQMFQRYVAKVDRDVVYVAMVIHVCYKCLFLMFHLCFRTYVASVFI
jgi:hypothetical protein